MRLLADECEHAGENGIGGETELLVEHLVGSRCSEVVETEHFAVGTHYATQSGGEAGGEAEGGHTGGEHCLTIVDGLVVEEADRGNRHHAGLDALGGEALGYFNEEGYL